MVGLIHNTIALIRKINCFVLSCDSNLSPSGRERTLLIPCKSVCSERISMSLSSGYHTKLDINRASGKRNKTENLNQLSTIIIYLTDWSVEIRLKNALARIIAWGKCQDHYLFKLWIIPYDKKYRLANYRNFAGVILYQPFNESKNTVLFIWYQYIIQQYCYIYNNII